MELPQSPNDLKRRKRLLRPRRHYQQHPILALRDRLHRLIDRQQLIIARRLPTAITIVILRH